MLLHHLVEFVVQVVVCVGFQGVFEQDPARHQQVVQPVRDVEDDSGCEKDGGEKSQSICKGSGEVIMMMGSIGDKQTRVMEEVGKIQETSLRTRTASVIS